MKIYSPLGNPRVHKILVAAHIAGVSIEWVAQDMTKIKEKEFLAKNPNGKVPVLEVKEGTYVWESNAILRYIGRLGKGKGLYGNNELDEAHVD
jgi:glutathione S-transferase